MRDPRRERCRLAASVKHRRTGWPRAQAGDCDYDLPCSPLDACGSASCEWLQKQRNPDKRKNRNPARPPTTERREKRASDDGWHG